MYQVISVRILRQAMGWMGIPSPWFRTTQTFSWPDGRLTSTIKCMWDYNAISEWVMAELEADQDLASYNWLHGFGQFLKFKLDQAFCEDVQVVQCRYEVGSHCFVAWLACTVMPHPANPLVIDHYERADPEVGAL